MAKYVALLRGIMPTNPNMRSEKLRGVFESLGFTNVETVIGSGNVLFQTGAKSISALEKKIEATFPAQLGFTSSTIVRSKGDIEALVQENPFKDISDEKPNYLVVTFVKDKMPTTAKYPRKEIGNTVLHAHDRAFSTVIDLNHSKTPDFMRHIEKEFGKNITTRTWKTVGRILQKMEK